MRSPFTVLAAQLAFATGNHLAGCYSRESRALANGPEAPGRACGARLYAVSAVMMAAAALQRPSIDAALACLIAAGAADMVSGIFRATLWNQTIPDALRGRLAGVELLSYGIGPPAGQLRSGIVAGLVGTRFSLVSGGLFCVGAVAVIAGLLPGFVRYKSEPA